MNNGYRTRIQPRDTGVWSWPRSTVHCFALLHCSKAGGGGGGTKNLVHWAHSGPGMAFGPQKHILVDSHGTFSQQPGESKFWRSGRAKMSNCAKMNFGENDFLAF